MAVTVTGKNLLTLSTCESSSDGGTWLILTTQDSDNVKQGTYSLCGIVKSTGNNDVTFTPTASKDLLNKHVRWWMILAQGSLIQTYANGGIQFWCSDGTNTGYWYVGGRDNYPGGWHNFVVDLSKAVDSGVKPSDAGMQAITSMGFRIVLTAMGKNAINTWVDYLNACDGLVIYGDDVGGYFDFEDIYSIANAPATGGLGILTKKAGTYCLTGMMEFGFATSVTKFQAKSQVVVFENRPNKDGTLSNINANLMNLTVIDSGNVLYTTEFILGEESGGQGISGCTVRVESTDQIAKYDIIAIDTDISDFKLYGSSFLDADSIQLPLTGTNIKVLNCNFESCGEIIPQTCIVKNCNVISANNRGIRIASSSHQVSDSNLINNTHGVNVNFSGSVTFINLEFSGSDGTTKWDIEHSVAGALTVTKSGTSNPQYVDETGGGNTSIVGSIDINVHVENAAGGDIVGAQVYVQKATPTTYTADIGNTAGNGALIVNEVVDTDTPQSGLLNVWDKSLNVLQPYRYVSWAVKTFTFRTEVTGTTTSLGTSTILYNTGADFGGITDILEGDTIRNTTDGSWAVVDEIVSATELLTSELQGGTNNIWGNGNGYSAHKLATTLIDGDDTVDVPLVNMQTNATGDITKVYTGAATSIIVRIRSNQGATKYLPYDTSGALAASDYSLTAVMAVDEVAA